MKSSPVLPGGSLKSKPTWSNTFGCSVTSVFFALCRHADTRAQVIACRQQANDTLHKVFNS